MAAAATASAPTAAAAATAGAGAAAAARRVLLLALMCAALAAAMPAHNKEGGGAAAAAAPPGDECVSGHRKPNEEAGCGGNCYCLGGRWVCPESECGAEGNIPKKFRSEDLEPFPLKRSKRGDSNVQRSATETRETSDVTAIVITERCVPHSRFRVDCNVCLCATNGIKARASCTVGPCPSTKAPPPPPTPRPCPATATAAANASASAPRRCRSVDAVDEGDAGGKEEPLLLPEPDPTLPPCTHEEKAANATHCVPVPLDGERCAPGVTYMDECNTCICSQDGIKAHASCTFKVCPK